MRVLERAPTVGKYLEVGVALHNTLTTGERFWLSEHGPDVRLNIASPWGEGSGMYQSHLCTIAIVLRVCSKAGGPDFKPAEIGFAYRSREQFPAVDLFADSRIVTGTPHSYVSIPRSLLKQRLSKPAAAGNQGDTAVHSLPTTPVGLLEWQIDALITEGGNLHIEAVAESLGMSKRSLQRAMANEGLNYSEVLGELRMRRALHWLDHTDKTVMEIAVALGYTDASNFARAFRRYTCLSPRAFREAGLRADLVALSH